MLQIQQYFVRVLPYKEMLAVTIQPHLDNFKPPCTLILDQATHTGFSIWDSNKSLVTFGALNKGRQQSVTEYKFDMVAKLEQLIPQFQITQILYEEIYLDNLATYDQLLYIKHAIEDLGHLQKVKVGGVASSTWKSTLARPNKFVGKGNDKAEVKKYVAQAFPLLFNGEYAEKITEDMIDVLGMGIALVVKYGRNVPITSVLKYNKKLPINTWVLNNNEQSIESVIQSSRKTSFKNALEREGLFEIVSAEYPQVLNGLRQFLTHRDGVAVAKLTKKHKEWGYFMLKENLTLQDVAEDGSFYLAAIRQNRK